ncbi:O-antigen ligase family protein [Caldibacillus debilis]|jgi:O-antigen ligase|uniref:Lipid A core-O-antigen ligase n=1 Tax=Caldibacillus debilis GB1 TaxID=1339248 RepID=A0A420VGX0_9BACI|nr:O-antigen ligase family protein [Caldibacillus debilis]RKO62835.1 Lipid A core - O-antigen ligase [Caldibacillus debilis GB1]
MNMIIRKTSILNMLLYLIVILSFFSYEYWIYNNVYQLAILLIFSLGVILLIVGLTDKVIEYKFIHKTRKNLMIYLLGILLLLSTLYSSIKFGSMTVTNLLSVIIMMMNFFIFFLFIPILIGGDLEKKINKLILLITIFSIIGIIIYLKGSFLGYSANYQRSSSIFFDPNYFGTICVVGFILSIYKKGIYKLFSILNLMALVFTGSRGAMLSLLIVIVIFYFYKKNFNIKTILAFLFLGIFIFYFLFFLYRIDFFRIYQGSNSRFFLWSISFELIKNEPIFGYGYGSVDELLRAQGAINGSSHNAYLDFIMMYGIPSFLIYLMIILKTLYQGIKNKVPRYIIMSILVLLINANTISINFGGLGATSLLLTLFLGICISYNSSFTKS